MLRKVTCMQPTDGIPTSGAVHLTGIFPPRDI